MKIDWSRLNIPQAIVLCVIILCAFGGAVALTVTNSWDKIPWQTIAAAIAVLGGAGASSLLGKLFHDPPRDPAARDRTNDPPPGAP